MAMVDLEPAAQRMAALLRNTPDDGLDGPTPCPEYTLGDLVEHVVGFARAFTAAARKANDREGGPPGDAGGLPPDWRTRMPDDLQAMADAWKDQDAWTGMTSAGGVELSGEAAGIVALDELVIHGWDVARSSGQPYDCDEPTLEAVLGFVGQFSETDSPEGLFGPRVPVAEDRPLLDRVLGLTGRDPDWTPA